MKKRWLKKWLAKTSEENRLKVEWVMGAFVLGTKDTYFQRGILRAVRLPAITVKAARRLESEGARKQLRELERAVGVKVVGFLAEAELSS